LLDGVATRGGIGLATEKKTEKAARVADFVIRIVDVDEHHAFGIEDEGAVAVARHDGVTIAPGVAFLDDLLAQRRALAVGVAFEFFRGGSARESLKDVFSATLGAVLRVLAA